MRILQSNFTLQRMFYCLKLGSLILILMSFLPQEGMMVHASDWTTVFIPQDGRTEIRHGNLNYTFSDYPNRESWETRAEHLRKRILVSTGLWPMPEKQPLNPQITGRIEHEDYIIENVYFESFPGFFVTGNLYRPKGKQGPFPGVASPHGHWSTGRLVHEELGSIPARGISFARQGYIAFAYDMIGYNDSKLQVPHTYGGDPKGYLWGISLMGLQLWNSIRVVDFLSSLPDVDPDRIACTGASGGGTQTFMLMAVDKRVKVAAPVNMISAHFQGGCLCENTPNLRLDNFNVEFGAMMAPRPLLMVSATGDWTKNTPEVEFPAVQSIYRLFGATDRVTSVQVNAEHNYNQESREAVYAWFGKWLLGVDNAEKFKEGSVTPDPPKKMLVFPDGKLPANAITGDQLVANLVQYAETQIQSLKPEDAVSLQAYQQVMGTAYRYAINAQQPQACDLQVKVVSKDDRENYSVEKLILGRKQVGEQMPAILLAPEHPSGAVIVVHPSGKAGLIEDDAPNSLIQGLLDRQLMVLAIDTFGTGELALLERDKDVRHFYTFNRSEISLRIQDILNAIAYLKTRTHTVHLVGIEEAGPWCLLARALTSDVRQTVVDAARYDYNDDDVWVDKLFIPQIRRAGDLRTAAAIIAPGKLIIHNVSDEFPRRWFRDVFEAAGNADAVHIQTEPMDTGDVLSHF